MFIRGLIDYGYQLIYGEPTPETLIDDVRAAPNGLLKKHYGLLGGNVYFVNPSPKVDPEGKLIQPSFKTADIFNSMDKKPHGRQADAGLRYVLGGDFINARTEKNESEQSTLMHHRLFNIALTRPADYIQSTLHALNNFIIRSEGECYMRDLSTIPLRNSIAKGLFDLDEITPEFNQALASFTGLTEERVETLETTIWMKLKLAYYGWVLNYMPKVMKARDQFIESVDQVIDGQKDKILFDINNYPDKTPTNILSLSIVQLIRDNNQIEQEQLFEYLRNMTEEELKPYLEDSYIRTLPAVISPADMIMIPVICALTTLATNQTLQQQLREEVAAREFFVDDDATRMKRNIDLDRQRGGLMHRIFLEALRREFPQKEIKDLERATMLWRYCEDGMMIGDEEIPPGSLIAVLNALQRFDKDIWHNPDVFDPDRFINTNGELNKDLEAVVMSIFTESRRKCPAHRVTEYIFQSFMAHIVSNYQLEMTTDPGEKNIDKIALKLSPQPPLLRRYSAPSPARSDSVRG